MTLHIGGKTCTTALITVEEGIFEIKSTSLCSNCGGDDIDNILTN